jgi:hypothetical protein
MHTLDIYYVDEKRRRCVLNGKEVKIRRLTIHSDIIGGTTAVIMEVYFEPLKIVNDLLVMFTWRLEPCEVFVELPGEW